MLRARYPCSSAALSFPQSQAPDLSRRREHRIAAGSCGAWHFLLHGIPMLNDFAVLDAEDIDGDHWLWSPTGVPSVNHDEVAIRVRHARLVGQASEGRNHLGNC